MAGSTLASRVNEQQASMPGPARDLLRPARDPAAGHAEPTAEGGSLGRVVFALQRSIGNAAVARLVEQARRGSGHPAPAVQDVLRGSGQPLAAPVRAEMEARLGADFSDVRVHADAAARASAAAVGARAYTSGSHVVFGEGGAGARTLAHELIHVIQQRRGPVAGTDWGSGLKVSDPADRFEREAARGDTRRGSPAVPGGPRAGSRPGQGPTIQRKIGRTDGSSDMSPDEVQYWLTRTGLWGNIDENARTVMERMINSGHQWTYGPMGAVELFRDAKALTDVPYHRGLIKGTLNRVENEADFHVDKGDASGLRADMLVVAEDVYRKMTDATRQHGAPNGQVYLRPYGAAIVKIVTQMLGEALGQPGLVEEAHGAIKWRKTKETMGNFARNLVHAKKPKMPDELIDESVFPEHSAYIQSLVGARGLTIRPVILGTRSDAEFYQNMLERSAAGHARLEQYLGKVKAQDQPAAMDIYISRNRLPAVIKLLRSGGG